MSIRLNLLCLLFATAMLPCSRASAAPPSNDPTAISKAPADVEYFRSILRLGETIEMVGRSEAWKTIWEDPAVQKLRKKALEGLADKDFEAVRQFIADPDNAQLPALSADACSREIFLYTGAGTGELVSVLQEIGGATRFGGAVNQLQGQNPADANKARIRMILQLLAEKPDRLRIPDLMIGFKVSDPVKVAEQLKRLDPVLTAALKDTPLKDKAQRTKLGDDDFLVLSLDGSLVPWDQIPLDMFEEKDGEFAPLIKHLKTMKLSVAVGVRQGYLLLCIGRSTDAVVRFGGEGAKLAGRPELEPLTKAANKPLLAVNYSSEKLRQAVATTAEDIQGTADLAKKFLPLAMLPDDLTLGLEKDIDAFARSMILGLVKPKAAFGYSVRTERGWETLDYDLTPSGLSSKQPLTLLDHIGGNPILAGIWRSGTSGEDYKTQVKWLTVLGGQAEKILRAKSPDAVPMLDMIRKEIFPLLAEMNETTEKLWLPALADGQSGIVIDAKWMTTQWHTALPKMDREMPIPEVAIILGVSDAGKLGQALTDYRRIANALLAKVRAMAPPDAIPHLEIPSPMVDQQGGRKYAWYVLPKEWGFDSKLQPTGGVGASVAAVALSRDHVDRLLNPSVAPIDLVPFADRKKLLDSAFILNVPELVSATSPWVVYAIESANQDNRKEVERTAGKVMTVLKVFHGYGSATWRENGTTITQSEMIIRDIPPNTKR